MNEQTIARVVLDIAHHDLDQLYDYRIPQLLLGKVRPGMRVFVPFGRGNRQREALVMELAQNSEYEDRLKDIVGLPGHMTALPAELMGMAEWMRDTYGCTRSEAVCLMLPAALRKLGGGKELLVASLAVPPEEAEKQAETLRACAPKQAALLELLCRLSGVALTELPALNQSPAAARALAKKGLLTIAPRSVGRRPRTAPAQDHPVQLNADQQAAVERITGQSGYAQLLLYGVTGSGKTEVYLRAVQACLARGKGALVLVPEIALTQQLMARFLARLGPQVAVLHSRLSAGERLDEWQRIASGEARVVLGARSAVFAPIENLGLLVMDEEQESGYDSGSHPRYRARQAAAYRARYNGCPLVLGSATPSIETYHRARQGEIALLPLPHRVAQRAMAKVAIVDMRAELRRGNPSIFSRALLDALADTFASGDQAILFINRRGYSAQIVCLHCGHALRCADCDVTLTYHRSVDAAVCHYCQASRPLPKVCPKCGQPLFRFAGVGTEQVEREFVRHFPQVACTRMDMDTMQGKDASAAALAAFGRGETQVLIGTQMIAKGLDFAGVALVGAVLAETTLLIPDFRSAERTFQLITQVAGRAGRGERPGKVVVQTFCPQHPVLRMAADQDYAAFYEWEIANRQRLGYSPFYQIVRMVVSGGDPAAVKRAAAGLYAAWQAVLAEQAIQPAELWAAPAPIQRIRKKWRYQIVAKLRTKELETLRPRLFALQRQRLEGDCLADLELDPANMI